MIELPDIVEILRERRQSYRYLDVFAKDVRELQAGSASRFRQVDADTFATEVDNSTLLMRMDSNLGVARFEIAGDSVLAAGAVGALAGAAIGAAVGAGGRSSDVPANALFGVLIGGLVGAAAGAAVRPNRVVTLVFDDASRSWRLYTGPYAQWAKEAMRREAV